MIKVLFVDDEVMAMDYLQNMISWEKEGFSVVGHARSGKKALEIYDREKPDIVISDIKMTGMDGLELAKRLKEKNPDVVVILLSAYRDFEYAQKGFEYGVSNYLLKHELCEEKLIEELKKAKERLKASGRKKKIYQKYFAKQLIYNMEDVTEIEEKELGNRFFLILVNKNPVFHNGVFHELSWSYDERESIQQCSQETDEEIDYVSDVTLTSGNTIILYKIGNINSRYELVNKIENTAKRIIASLSKSADSSFNIIYSNEIKRAEISGTFQKMSRMIHYSIFWKKRCIYALERLGETGAEEKISWNEQEKELRGIIFEGRRTDDFISYLFELVRYPRENLRGFRDLLFVLDNLAKEMEDRHGITHIEKNEKGYKIQDIENYYINKMNYISETIQERTEKKYSNIVVDMMRYINKNYGREISLESLGEEFQMNGVYLGQIFRKETGTTFLKYLTALRIEEAKRLLAQGEKNVSEVSEMVGYKTSQYFSQIFIKNVGMKPQEYKKWRKDI